MKRSLFRAFIPTLVVLALTLLLYACEKKALRVVPTDNSDIELKLLFEIDGCRIYRFQDEGSSRYVTVCGSHQTASTQWNESHPCGKGCVHIEHFDVPTVQN